MGDSGSQVLGFSLAALGPRGELEDRRCDGRRSLFLPILILAVPILDTTLVTVVRLLEGRPVTQGGRDHASHRLVYSGLSEKRAVVLPRGDLDRARRRRASSTRSPTTRGSR